MMEHTDSEQIVVCGEETPPVPQMQTAAGAKVKLIREDGPWMLLEYTEAKSYAACLRVPFSMDEEDAPALLTKMQSQISLEDETGNEWGEIMLPMDSISLSDGVGVIYESDLQTVTEDFQAFRAWQQTLGLSRYYGLLARQAKSFAVLEHNGYYLTRVDDRHFRYNGGYGVLRILAEPDVVTDNPGSDGENLQKMRRDLVLLTWYLLGRGDTGWEDFCRIWEQEGGAANLTAALETLPRPLANLFGDVMQGRAEAPAPDVLAAMLEQAAKDTGFCLLCGAEISRQAKRCSCCGRETGPEKLLLRIRVENDHQPGIFRLVWGGNTVMPGKTVSPNLPDGPLTQMLYHPIMRVVGLKNLSKHPWTVQTQTGDTVVKPGGVAMLQPGTTLVLNAHTKMIFERFEGTDDGNAT